MFGKIYKDYTKSEFLEIYENELSQPIHSALDNFYDDFKIEKKAPTKIEIYNQIIANFKDYLNGVDFSDGFYEKREVNLLNKLSKNNRDSCIETLIALVAIDKFIELTKSIKEVEKNSDI